MVVEQVDEAAKGFGGTFALGGLKQQIHQVVVDVGATGIGLLQHAADHAGPCRIAEQCGAEPALPHHRFQQRSDPGHPGGLGGQLLVVHQALGAVDQHHATASLAQQLCGPQGNNPADRVAHQSHRAIDDLAAEVSHLLAPEIKAVMNGIR